MQFIKHSTSTEGPSNMHHDTTLQNYSNKLSVQPKIRIFLLIAMLNILPIGKNLLKIGLYESINCIHCGFQFKDDRHALFDFVLQKKLGSTCLLGRKQTRNSGLNFKDLMCSLSLQYEKKEVYIFATCAWLISFPRNKLRHGGSITRESMIVFQATYSSDVFLKLHERYLKDLQCHNYQEPSWCPLFR